MAVCDGDAAFMGHLHGHEPVEGMPTVGYHPASLPGAGTGGRGACVGYAADWAAWRSVDNSGCSIKPYQVFIGADVEHELTFGLDHFVGADHFLHERFGFEKDISRIAEIVRHLVVQLAGWKS